jgi:hypothetical protein
MTIDLSTLPTVLLPMAAFCIGIYFLVLCVRYIAEVKHPELPKKPGWKKILRVMPPVFGGVAAAFMYKYPFLDTLPTWGTRFIYGCFGGGIASFAYLVFKAAVAKWFGVKVEKGLGDSDCPPSKKE